MGPREKETRELFVCVRLYEDRFSRGRLELYSICEWQTRPGMDPLALLEKQIYRMVERAILYGCGYAQRITRKARIQIRRYMLKRCSSCSSDM